MIGVLLRLLAPFFAVVLASYWFPDWIGVASYQAAFVFAIVLAVLNAIVRPILNFLTFPITCLTLGLFHFVLNAVMFFLAAWVTQQFLGQGVEVNGFIAALVGALFVSGVSLVTSLITR